jgi:isoleucyl-tRNA synthetase
MFQPLPSVPDHPGLEREVLDWWDEQRVFERLRELNREGPQWSFVDGPITANNPMGVHHCWGRTLKDVFQRYKALQGFDQRYQNGFDCQGLWVEVNVERALGLNSKPEIEEYGLAAFAEKCKESVAEYSEVITDQSKRLGMWMDWENDYYTFSDTNIEYIWRFLKTVHEREWLYKGHRSNVWCPRCGTSISQHELIGSYEDRSDPSLYVRLPLLDDDGEALVVWTTTPWTLPANVAAAVDPQADYVKLSTADGFLWVAEGRLPELPFGGEVVAKVKGEELVGKRYEGPYDHLPAAEGVEHRVIPWSDVTMEEGTGIVHIAPGCGAEDFDLAREHDLPVLTPVDEAGRFYDGYGWLHGTSTAEAKEQIIGDLGERGRLLEAGEIVHRYPVCWRCHTPLIFRIVDEWFISCDEIRQPMLDANATVAWTPDFYSKRMDDWLRNMGDWNISRKRYFGLPLPFYPCECGRVNVVGSRSELEERATGGLDQLQELHRPWVDQVPIRCDACGEEVRRVPEVGDAWLDAGIVPFSTLGWENPEWREHGYANGASTGLSGADLPDHAYWEKWFPADWVSEMREQIRLWFYSQLFMSVALVGRAPYRQILAYEKLRDETGKEMHKSWGNAIEANEAMDKMGADVMRFMYCDHVPQQNLNFGYGPANEVKRRLLTFWNSASFFVLYANIEGFRPSYRDLERGPESDDLRPLDRWLLARTQQLLEEAADAYERFWTPDVTGAWERFTDDLSNWYIRRSRKRFYTLDEAAFKTLWYALVQGVRVIAPVMPFLAEHLWRNLAASVRQAPESVFLAGWPESSQRFRDPELLEEVAGARRVAELARAARDAAGIRLRQPLRRLVVATSDPGRRMLISRQVEDLAAELRVKEVAIHETPAEVAEMRAKARLDLVGPRYGQNLPELRRLLDEGSFEVTNGTLRAGAYILSRGEFMLDYTAREGWEVKHEDDYVVGVDTRLDEALETEGRVYDLIHSVQRLRRDAGLEVTDRIVLTIPASDEGLLEHRDWIAAETLAEDIEAGDELAVRRAG